MLSILPWVFKWLQWHFPVFTVVLTLAAIVLSILYGIREFFKHQK